MGFMDVTDAEMRALKRLHRRELHERQFPGVVTIYIRGFGGVEFSQTIRGPSSCLGRRTQAHRAWKQREWRAGRRHCAYCGVLTIRIHNHTRAMTVDHKQPLSAGGADQSWNWCVACRECNGRKASMLEGEYRALMSLPPPD